MTDLTALGEKQIVVDCDVLQADGGTRTASITGAWIALYDAIQWMKARNMVKGNALRDHVAAVSCGLYGGVAGARSRLCGRFRKPTPTPISS